MTSGDAVVVCAGRLDGSHHGADTVNIIIGAQYSPSFDAFFADILLDNFKSAHAMNFFHIMPSGKVQRRIMSARSHL